MGSPLHLSQLPSYNLAVCRWPGGLTTVGLVTGVLGPNMAIDAHVAFQASISSYPDATVALGHAPG